jgi:hypothetical protein
MARPTPPLTRRVCERYIPSLLDQAWSSRPSPPGSPANGDAEPARPQHSTCSRRSGLPVLESGHAVAVSLCGLAAISFGARVPRSGGRLGGRNNDGVRARWANTKETTPHASIDRFRTLDIWSLVSLSLSDCAYAVPKDLELALAAKLTFC